MQQGLSYNLKKKKKEEKEGEGEHISFSIYPLFMGYAHQSGSSRGAAYFVGVGTAAFDRSHSAFKEWAVRLSCALNQCSRFLNRFQYVTMVKGNTSP